MLRGCRLSHEVTSSAVGVGLVVEAVQQQVAFSEPMEVTEAVEAVELTASDPGLRERRDGAGAVGSMCSSASLDSSGPLSALTFRGPPVGGNGD